MFCNTKAVCFPCACAVESAGRTLSAMPANANFVVLEKPKHLVRRDPRKAAEDFKKRFKGSLKILA